MWDIISRMFDPSGFVARANCGQWTDMLRWLTIGSDIAIWAAYFAIPCILGYFILLNRGVPFRFIFWLFCAFILACRPRISSRPSFSGRPSTG